MDEIQPWLFPVKPLEAESLSHFFGRIRRRNHLSPSALGHLAGIGAVISRWERFYLNPFPTHEQLEGLGHLLGLDATRLRQMLPTPGESIKCEPIRICGACYRENLWWIERRTSFGIDNSNLSLPVRRQQSVIATSICHR